MRRFFAPDPETTLSLGERLGRVAPAGTTVALIGDLGAGKTVFAKGVGAGLGVHKIQSPTFVIVQSHPDGRLPLWHVDLYRLSRAEDIEQLGLDELIDGEGVVLIEWADRLPSVLPGDHLEVHLVEEGTGRSIAVHGHGPRAAALEVALG